MLPLKVCVMVFCKNDTKQRINALMHFIYPYIESLILYIFLDHEVARRGATAPSPS